jgi:hypothetical protein
VSSSQPLLLFSNRISHYVQASLVGSLPTYASLVAGMIGTATTPRFYWLRWRLALYHYLADVHFRSSWNYRCEPPHWLCLLIHPSLPPSLLQLSEEETVCSIVSHRVAFVSGGAMVSCNLLPALSPSAFGRVRNLTRSGWVFVAASFLGGTVPFLRARVGGCVLICC